MVKFPKIPIFERGKYVPYVCHTSFLLPFWENHTTKVHNHKIWSLLNEKWEIFIFTIQEKSKFQDTMFRGFATARLGSPLLAIFCNPPWKSGKFILVAGKRFSYITSAICWSSCWCKNFCWCAPIRHILNIFTLFSGGLGTISCLGVCLMGARHFFWSESLKIP